MVVVGLVAMSEQVAPCTTNIRRAHATNWNMAGPGADRGTRALQHDAPTYTSVLPCD